ncbi:MAG: hypothetical protein JSS09_02885, partial [Verrucomicrobia bacterium]|nr:hypothetical protein [Verrucomicrobiota bacterium]
ESAVSSNTVLFADLEPTSASPFTVTGPISHSPFIIAEEPVFFSTSGLPKSIASSLKTHILTHDSFHMTRTVDTEYIFHNHEWHAIIAKPPKGTDSEVLICEKFAFKFLHNQTGWNEIKRSEAILERVNFDGTAIGIAKRPITELAEKNLTVYSLTASGLVTTENNQIQAQLEEVFQSDCLDAIDRIETFEIQSIASCIVQGSKTLIENGIYHLDTKLENIGYLGNGRAIHFDLGGSSDITEKEWINYSPAFTRRDNFKKELTNAILETNPDLKKNKLEKIHIFQLGSALFHLATKKIPYGNDPDKFIPPSTLESDFERLRKELQDSLAYSDSQIEIIAAMLSKKPIERPSIEEIQAVFPIDLILASNNPT